MKKFLISSEFENTRLDRWFRKEIFNAPQSYIEKNLRKGNIKINNKKNKSSYRLKKNDLIFVKELKFKKDENLNKKYIYIPDKKDLSNTSNIFIENNENFVVINKPAGISVQSGSKSKKNIIDILRLSKEFYNASPFPVHRIDKETTGVLIVAKNRKYAQLFTSLFRIRKINKTYLGIVKGVLSSSKGVLENDLFYYEGDKKIKTRAVTNFKVLNSNNNYSFLELNPITGRKHQLRKQLLLYDCPILGDSKYRLKNSTKNKNENLMLHAYKINFSINNIKYKFKAELPDTFKKNLKEKYLEIFQK